MTDWFEWKGVRCTTYGIHVSEHPPITVPEERVTFIDVPGRSGSLTRLEAEDTYDDMVLTVTCFIENTNNINTIAGWLKGAGTVTFANRPGGFYYARVVNQIPFEQILRGRPNKTFTVNFRCKPFWYKSNVADITLTNDAGTINNPGSVYSKPLVVVTGSGDVTIGVNGKILELHDLNGSITMDSELEEAWSGSSSANDQMEGDFIILKSGANSYVWDGNITSIVITPRWRYL